MNLMNISIRNHGKWSISQRRLHILLDPHQLWVDQNQNNVRGSKNAYHVFMVVLKYIIFYIIFFDHHDHSDAKLNANWSIDGNQLTAHSCWLNVCSTAVCTSKKTRTPHNAYLGPNVLAIAAHRLGFLPSFFLRISFSHSLQNKYLHLLLQICPKLISHWEYWLVLKGQRGMRIYKFVNLKI